MHWLTQAQSDPFCRIHVVQHLRFGNRSHKARVTYANDGTEDVDITEVVGIDINGRRTTEETLVLGSEVLIGQTVLESLDLQVDCLNHRVIPNPAHPDQPVIKIKWICRTPQAIGSWQDASLEVRA